VLGICWLLYGGGGAHKTHEIHSHSFSCERLETDIYKFQSIDTSKMLTNVL